MASSFVWVLSRFPNNQLKWSFWNVTWYWQRWSETGYIGDSRIFCNLISSKWKDLLRRVLVIFIIPTFVAPEENRWISKVFIEWLSDWIVFYGLSTYRKLFNVSKYSTYSNIFSDTNLTNYHIAGWICGLMSFQNDICV